MEIIFSFISLILFIVILIGIWNWFIGGISSNLANIIQTIINENKHH